MDMDAIFSRDGLPWEEEELEAALHIKNHCGPVPAGTEYAALAAGKPVRAAVREVITWARYYRRTPAAFGMRIANFVAMDRSDSREGLNGAATRESHAPAATLIRDVYAAWATRPDLLGQVVEHRMYTRFFLGTE